MKPKIPPLLSSKSDEPEKDALELQKLAGVELSEVEVKNLSQTPPRRLTALGRVESASSSAAGTSTSHSPSAWPTGSAATSVAAVKFHEPLTEYRTFGATDVPSVHKLGFQKSLNERLENVVVRKMIDVREAEHARKVQKYSQKKLHIPTAVKKIEKHFREKLQSELLIYIIFIILFISLALTTRQIHPAFETTSSLSDLFLDEEFVGAQYKKNFAEIQTMEEFWEWLEGPFLSGFYPEEWYNGEWKDDNERRIVANQNYLSGGIELRQIRVHTHKCLSADQFNCTTYFAASHEDRTPYGPQTEGFTWSDGHSRLPVGLIKNEWHSGGRSLHYGTGGYTVLLQPGDREAASAAVLGLKENLWIDRQTTAVAVSFNVVSYNHDLIVAAQYLVEFTPGGFVSKTPRYEFISAQQTFSPMKFIALITFAAFILYYIREEALQLKHQGLILYLGFWNLIELLNLTMFVIIAVFFAVGHFALEDTRRSIRNDTFVDSWDTLWFIRVVANLTACNLVLCFIKIFKFLRLNTRMNILWQSLEKAAVDLLAFLIIFIICFVGFSLMAYLSFGHTEESFHSVVSSISTCFRMLVGEVNYNGMAVANPTIAPIFMGGYLIFVFFILANIFIAILTEFYQKTSFEAEQTESKVEYDILKRMRWVMAKRSAIRVRQFRNASEIDLVVGQTFIFVGEKEILGTNQRAAVTFKEFHRLIKPGQQILIDDGLILMTVQKIERRKVYCVVNKCLGRLRVGQQLKLPGLQILLLRKLWIWMRFQMRSSRRVARAMRSLLGCCFFWVPRRFMKKKSNDLDHFRLREAETTGIIQRASAQKLQYMTFEEIKARIVIIRRNDCVLMDDQKMLHFVESLSIDLFERFPTAICNVNENFIRKGSTQSVIDQALNHDEEKKRKTSIYEHLQRVESSLAKLEQRETKGKEPVSDLETRMAKLEDKMDAILAVLTK